MVAAECLAVALDPFGARETVMPFADDSGRREAAVLAAWNRAVPRDWPADTLIVLANGDTSVVVTMLSRNVGSFDQAWYAIAHSFTFDQGGDIAAWNSRKSAPFGKE
jgi:hypothetical protein